MSLEPIEIERVVIESGVPGPHLLVMAALHGNEYPGVIGARAVVEAFASGAAQLTRGRLTVIPVANPAGYAQRVRYINVNPNRVFRRHEAPANYEEQLVTQLCDDVDACDYFIDIHSFTSQATSSFLFVDHEDGEHVPFAKALGIPCLIMGWAAVMENDAHKAGIQDSNIYAHKAGKTSITVECGQHDAPDAPAIAAMAVWRGLKYLQMIEEMPPLDVQPAAAPVSLRIFSKIIKSREGTLTPGFMHLSPIPAGTTLARFEDGSELTAPEDAVVILPKGDALLGDEWCYLARPE